VDIHVSWTEAKTAVFLQVENIGNEEKEVFSWVRFIPVTSARIL
jgi:hypothetical protein